MQGAGLLNLGNTCFLNAIVQCFTHTVLLIEGLRSFDHVIPCDCKYFIRFVSFVFLVRDLIGGLTGEYDV